jgi:predicted sulfurtransferase
VLAKNGKWYPRAQPAASGNVSLLLFYAYVQPVWTARERTDAIEFTNATLSRLGCTGRLRVALEGFNGTLTGPAQGLRDFCAALRDYNVQQFGSVDFKIVDGLADNKGFRTLKVWPVAELVTYGFAAKQAPLTLGSQHVTPEQWNTLAAAPNTVMIDVRNANETAIGRFAPPAGGAKLLDPHMRRSTEFPEWVDTHLEELKGKKVMMYCTAGVRCERASAFLAQKGIERENIVQLEGGIHRYLEAFPEDGGLWAGANYTFDKRFSHGAAKGSVISACAACAQPWQRYQSGDKCSLCKMEILVCRECHKAKVSAKRKLLCWLCTEAGSDEKAAARARAFARTGGGRDGEGEGAGAQLDAEEDAPSGGSSKRQRRA